MVTISGDNIRTATITKANDNPEGPLFSFKSEIMDFGPYDDGDPRTVNIVAAEAFEGSADRAAPRDGQEGLICCVREAVDAALIE